MSSSGSFWTAPFRIFGMVFFAFVSFFVLLFLFSLMFIAAGFGFGSASGKKSLTDFALSESSNYRFISGNKQSQNLLLSAPVTGVILGSPSVDLPSALRLNGATYGYEIKKILDEAAKDEKIKGVFLHLQTPGGTIFGAKAIFDGIKAFQSATGKPVLAFIEGLSASGGVMAMIGADAIYADYGSMIGSIGILGPSLTYFNKPTATDGGLFGGGIVTQGGIERTVITGGRGKDLGNPFRQATKEELATLQQGVDTEYHYFVRHVALNRDIPENVIIEEMGAQIFDNQAARRYKLIDGTLSREEALAKLVELAGIHPNDFQLVRARREVPPLWEELFWSFLPDAPKQNVQQAVTEDLCRMARMPMAYYGDVREICPACSAY